MGRIQELNDKFNTLAPFVKLDKLAEIEGHVLCILAIDKKHDDIYGWQWKIRVLVDPETAESIETTDNNEAVVTFGMLNNSRDKLMESLKEENQFPVHCLHFDVAPMKNGKPFYKCVEWSGTCACGDNSNLVSSNGTVDYATMEESPF